MRKFLAALSFACLLAAEPARAYDVGLNVYLGSYHSTHTGANGAHNEPRNPGLGLRYGGRAFLEAGAYSDSRRNLARYAGVGYQWGDRFRYGGMLIVARSRSYNLDETFVAPLPLLSYSLTRNAIANALYLPKLKKLNDAHILGFYVTVVF
jgi:hypothetical protein